MHLYAEEPTTDMLTKTALYEMSGAWFRLDRYMFPCLLSNNPCTLDSSKLDLLKKIYTHYPDEVQKTKLVLIDPKKNPSVFNSAIGTHRLATTDLKPYSPINLNQDLIIDLQNKTVLPIEKSVALFVHELGHHLGIGDDQERTFDQIGEAVMTEFQNNSQVISPNMKEIPLVLSLIHNTIDLETLKKIPSSPFHFAEFINYSGENAKGYKDVIISETLSEFPKECPNQNSIKLTYLKNARYYSLPDFSSPNPQKISVIADLTIVCGSSISSGKLLNAYFVFDGELEKNNTGNWIISHDKQFGHVTKSISGSTENNSVISNIKFNSYTLQNEGTWSGEMTVTLDQPKELIGCESVITSTSFYQYVTGESMGLPFDQCQITKVDSKNYKIITSISFSNLTPTSDYFIKYIELYSKDKNAEPILASPSIRQILHFQNSNPSQKLTMNELFLKDKSDLRIPGHDHQISVLENDDHFYLSVVVSGEVTSIAAGMLQSSALTKDNKIIYGQFSFQDNSGKIVNPITIQFDGINTTITFEIHPFKDFPFSEFKSITPTTLNLIDSNYRTLNITIPKDFIINMK